MVGRVLLDSGLRVSKPGIEVTTAGPLDLAFNSSFSQLGMLLVNEIDCNWSHAYDWYEFSFGKTFPSPPIVHMQRVISAGQFQELSPVGSFFIELFGGAGGTANRHMVIAETTTSAIRVFSLRGGTNPDFRLRYTVMDYNL